MAVDGRQTLGEIPENLNDRYVNQLREWCRKLGLSASGGRAALQNRLEKKHNPRQGSEGQAHSSTTVSTPPALQLTREEMQTMISSSVQQAVADISKHVTEAYRTTTEDAGTAISSNHQTTESNSNPQVPPGEQQSATRRTTVSRHHHNGLCHHDFGAIWPDPVPSSTATTSTSTRTTTTSTYPAISCSVPVITATVSCCK